MKRQRYSTENKKTAIGNFVPSFNINGNHSWNTGLTQNITTGILENQTTENSSMNMSVGIDVFNGLANIRRLHRANLDLLAKKYQLEDMKEDISLLVANSYLQILFNKEQLDVQKSQLKISQESNASHLDHFVIGFWCFLIFSPLEKHIDIYHLEIFTSSNPPQLL